MWIDTNLLQIEEQLETPTAGVITTTGPTEVTSIAAAATTPRMMTTYVTAMVWPLPMRSTKMMTVTPARVFVMSHPFVKSRFGLPLRGVTHYREDTPRDAAHMRVSASGEWVIDHLDKWNPDRGLLNLLMHLVFEFLPSVFRR